LQEANSLFSLRELSKILESNPGIDPAAYSKLHLLGRNGAARGLAVVATGVGAE
jgi:hypothetical protein